MTQVEFLENYFIGSFPELENLKELRIIGLEGVNRKSKLKGRYEIANQLKESNLGYYKSNSFTKLKLLDLRNLYISLDTFDHLVLMFSLTNHFDERRSLNNYQKVSAVYELKFQDGTSRNQNYNINKYQSLSIQEESNFMLSSDFNNLGFTNPDDLNSKNKNEYETIINSFQDKNFQKNSTFNNKYKTQLGHDFQENGNFHVKDNINYSLQSLTFSQQNSQVMQPFMDIKTWVVRISKNQENKDNDNINKVLFQLNTRVFILDNQIREMKYQSITEIHRNLVSKTVLEYLVDPLKTHLSISNSRIILSLGFDNLIYSGYFLRILFEYQKTIKQLSALSLLIPIDFFCQLELNQIQILKVSLFKDKNLEPRNLIQLCAWIEKYGKNLNSIHIRVTGSSSKWTPKETEITRLVNLWKKMCPKVQKSRDQIKFECCFTDHIFSKMENISKNLEFDTDSD